MRKDRYSALLMANMAARCLARMPTPQAYQFYGGFATISEAEKKRQRGDDFSGPNWFTENMNDIY